MGNGVCRLHKSAHCMTPTVYLCVSFLVGLIGERFRMLVTRSHIQGASNAMQLCYGGRRLALLVAAGSSAWQDAFFYHSEQAGLGGQEGCDSVTFYIGVT
jgi:hypothetical protein